MLPPLQLPPTHQLPSFTSLCRLPTTRVSLDSLIAFLFRLRRVYCQREHPGIRPGRTLPVPKNETVQHATNRDSPEADQRTRPGHSTHLPGDGGLLPRSCPVRPGSIAHATQGTYLQPGCLDTDADYQPARRIRTPLSRRWQRGAIVLAVCGKKNGG